MLRIAFILALLVPGHALATEVYRSVDENGRPVFSNTPPETDHEVLDVKIKNKLGEKNQPDPSSRYYTFPGNSSYRPPSRNSSGRRDKKVSGAKLQENCERYRNIVRGNNKQREKREYWCGRLHRGK